MEIMGPVGKNKTVFSSMSHVKGLQDEVQLLPHCLHLMFKNTGLKKNVNVGNIRGDVFQGTGSGIFCAVTTLIAAMILIFLCIHMQLLLLKVHFANSHYLCIYIQKCISFETFIYLFVDLIIYVKHSHLFSRCVIAGFSRLKSI